MRVSEPQIAPFPSRQILGAGSCQIGTIRCFNFPNMLTPSVLQILQKPTHELKQQLAGYSKRVASSVTELIQAAEAMKGERHGCIHLWAATWGLAADGRR